MESQTVAAHKSLLMFLTTSGFSKACKKWVKAWPEWRLRQNEPMPLLQRQDEAKATGNPAVHLLSRNGRQYRVTWRSDKNKRPTGIIRTLPWYGAEDSKHSDSEKGKAYKRMMRGFKALEKRDGHVYVALAQRPTIEVLHCYILIGGIIRVRANIADYWPGSQVGKVECWDDSTRDAKWWAVLTAPISWPEVEIRMKGFQGFRYCQELW